MNPCDLSSLIRVPLTQSDGERNHLLSRADDDQRNLPLGRNCPPWIDDEDARKYLLEARPELEVPQLPPGADLDQPRAFRDIGHFRTDIGVDRQQP